MERVTFEGQAVVVTGGGRGLGRAYCHELARRGASVVVNDVSAEHADEVVGEIEGVGGSAVAVHDSVATPEGGEAIIRRALDAFGRLDAVISNAGILRNAPFEDLTLEQIDAVFDVNLRGVFFVAQPAWRVMKANGYGRLVLTSSAAGLFSRAGSVNYSAAKAAMYGMCRALSFEGADHGIAVNVVLPRASTTITSGSPVRDPLREDESLFRALEPRRQPATNAALACYLASRACTVTGEAFSSALGAYARVFVGRARGWVSADPTAISVEDVALHLDEIRELDGYTIPDGNYAEVETITAQLGIASGA